MDHSSKFSTHSCLCSFTYLFSHGLNHGRNCWLCSFMPQNTKNLKPSSRSKSIDSTHGYPWELCDHKLVKCLAACFWWVASQEGRATWGWVGSPASTVERWLACKSAETSLIPQESYPQSFSGPPNPPKGNIHLWKAECCLNVLLFWKFATAMVPFQNSAGITPKVTPVQQHHFTFIYKYSFETQ